jgi:SAM-dependent methyltransferase
VNLFKVLLRRMQTELEQLKERVSRVAALEAEVARQRVALEHLELELSRHVSLLRLIAAPQINDTPFARQTRASFDYQWEQLPLGRWNLDHPEFRKEAAGYVCQFTALPREWFAGKRTLDAGCGAGRYSWAMCTMGAEVLSIDQSPHGLARTKRACQEFPTHRTKQVNLLEPLGIEEQFDLVWSFGVLHHTGDTYGCYQRLAPLVRPGGYLFLMLYGEPRRDHLDDYRAVIEYERWRQLTRNLTFDERLSAVREAMGRKEFMANGEEYVEGYFDAISPLIADLYSWPEIESWLVRDGFVDVRRTVDTRNHHVIARRPATSEA